MKNRYEIMKYQLFFLLYLSSVFALNIYSLDLTSSSLEWIGRKLTGIHNGNIQFSSGEVIFNDKRMLSGEFIINMQTIQNNDISSDKYRGYLEEHLKSEDFFNVDSFPNAKLIIKKNLGVTDLGKESIILCDRTIKGITHQIEIPVRFNVYNNHATASGTIDIDRTLYDIKYNSRSFFPNIGDKLIYDYFTLNFTIRVNREWEN